MRVCARALTHIHAHDSNYACRGEKEEGFIAIRTTHVSARVRVIVTRVCACMCVCMCVYVCARACVFIYVFMYVCMYLFTSVCLCTYMYVLVYKILISN